jgi:hypothetical protein
VRAEHSYLRRGGADMPWPARRERFPVQASLADGVDVQQSFCTARETIVDGYWARGDGELRGRGMEILYTVP